MFDCNSRACGGAYIAIHQYYPPLGGRRAADQKSAPNWENSTRPNGSPDTHHSFPGTGPRILGGTLADICGIFTMSAKGLFDDSSE